VYAGVWHFGKMDFKSINELLANKLIVLINLHQVLNGTLGHYCLEFKVQSLELEIFNHKKKKKVRVSG